MAKKKTTKKKRRGARDNPAGLKNPLIFIDTNILLDFYRARNEQGLALLKRIDDIHKNCIVTYQVEMEFKKNRQSAIIESLNALKLSGQIDAPAYLRDHRSVQAARGNLEKARKQVASVKDTLQKAMLDASTHDEVYKGVQRLLTCESPFNLKRENDLKRQIRRRAMKRFMLGYPPRKNNDTSIGDAINWEWIIECAVPKKRDVVIVSRDSDFGMTYGKNSYVNDWLVQEFRQRVNAQGRIRLTQRLSEGLELLNKTVTAEEKAGEEEIIEDVVPKSVSTEERFRKILLANTDPEARNQWAHIIDRLKKDNS